MDMENRQDEFKRLLLSSQREMFRYIVLYVANRHDAEDIMQDAVSWMWEHFDQYVPDSNFVGWGIQVARFKARGFRTSAARRCLQFRNDVVELIDARVETRAAREDRGMDELLQCLSELEADERELIYLRYEKGLSTRKVAHVLGRPVHGMYRTMARIHGGLLHGVHRKLMLEEAC